MRHPVLRLRAALFALVVLAGVSGLAGCGIIDTLYLPVSEDTAQELWEAGTDAMNATDYYTAAVCFTKLKDRFPFSPYTVKAELALADAYFLDKEYLEAMGAYLEFENLHPRHSEIPYVLFQIGRSGLSTFTSIDLPQQPVAEGMEYLERLVEQHPDSPYAQEAVKLIAECREILCKRELFVADFYFRTEQYGGAWRRYQFVMENFKEQGELVEYAKLQSELSYLRFQQSQSEKFRRKEQGHWKDEYFSWL
ncbi:outer membrane protein assembly factor BamD [Megalodesulfovibrio gigas]|uniref:Putative lipoprotein n=1 Tax=Megalodesulfovibrio gigas (strain ATCC 19364 / DSM 1382 / NCIMB 9332 / VKM B-1759) TaxID=1121448 RepID=T2GDR1_MEGG1|nr:outer membrane protein assembly factor BamD [Megalodesulfovibrio gigas]AGW14256.1 putative lipoprotein [Megalodesulfovibrio gigas DSM 1382 = ATCC 19364]